MDKTAFRPGIHFVAIKTAEQQDIKALRASHQLMVEQRTALANQARSLAAEQLISPVLRQQKPKYKVLMAIPDIGPLTAAAFLSEVNAAPFTNGRQLSA